MGITISNVIPLLLFCFCHLISEAFFLFLANPCSADDDEESGKSSYEERLSRLRANHTLPEFKLSCWARMLVRD